MLWIGLLSFWGLHRFLYEIIEEALLRFLPPIATVLPWSEEGYKSTAVLQESLTDCFFSMHYYFVPKKIAANGLYCIHRFQEQCCYGAFPLRFCCDACDCVVSNICIVTDQFSSGLVHFLLGKIQICIVTLQHCNFNACSYFP
jgi:hypothetical protein